MRGGGGWRCGLILHPCPHPTVFEFMPYMGITLATVFTMLRLANEAKMRQAICSGTCPTWACRSGHPGAGGGGRGEQVETEGNGNNRRGRPGKCLQVGLDSGRFSMPFTSDHVAPGFDDLMFL